MVDYKKLDKTILQWCPFVLILLLIIAILFSSIGGRNQSIGWYIFITIFSFTIFYMILSLLFWIIGLLSKEFKENYQTKFYLKISTIIATIIIILIVSSLFCFGCGSRNVSPITNTKSLLKTQMDNPGAEQCTYTVIFTRSSPALSSKGITANTGLDPNQVYFDNPLEIPNFDISNPKILRYTGATNKKVIMCILCSSNGKSGLEQALIQNGITSVVNSTTEEETHCVVYPRKALG